MRSRNTESLMALAKSQDSAISKAIAQSIEVGVVVPSLLRSKLAALSLDVQYTQGKHLVRADVFDSGVLIASGTSADQNDALLHAMLGYVRERAIGSLVVGGMTKAQAVHTVMNG